MNTLKLGQRLIHSSSISKIIIVSNGQCVILFSHFFNLAHTLVQIIHKMFLFQTKLQIFRWNMNMRPNCHFQYKSRYFFNIISFKCCAFCCKNIFAIIITWMNYRWTEICRHRHGDKEREAKKLIAKWNRGKHTPPIRIGRVRLNLRKYIKPDMELFCMALNDNGQSSGEMFAYPHTNRNWTIATWFYISILVRAPGAIIAKM